MTQHPNAYNYDARLRRYRNATNGRIVKAEEVRKSVDTLIQAETITMQNHAQDLLDGKINFAEWQIRSMGTIKQLHVAVALAGNGGRNNTTPSDLGYIGSLIKGQYEYFRGMVGDIRKGKQPLNGSLVSRAGSYGLASLHSYELMRRRSAIAQGLQYECNVLGSADSCHGASNGCVEQTKRGWVKIGELVPVGERLCLYNCHCTTQQK